MGGNILLSWSSGKDSAWALEELRHAGTPVTGLLTTFEDSTGRVGIHGTPLELVAAQADAVDLPLATVALPSPCSDARYRKLLGEALETARRKGFDRVAFGDLFLEDIRRFRAALVETANLEPIFPLWTAPEKSAALARAQVAGGIEATVVSVDPARLPRHWLGRPFDDRFLDELPAGVDPCGENGEFHTFCTAAPSFEHALEIARGDIVEAEPMSRLEVVLKAPGT